jgi:hypothetical protein
MLSTLFSMCRRGDSCSKTTEEESKRVRGVLATSKYDIIHYAQTHPLYDHYSKFISDHSSEFGSVICRGEIPSSYIESRQEKQPILTIARTLSPEGKVMYKGFAQSAISKSDDSTIDLHIFTICTVSNSGLGRPIIESLESYVKRHVKLNSISLDSVADATEFYQKLGFQYEAQDKEGDEVFPMKKTVGGYSPFKYFSGLSSRKKTQRRKEISKFGKMSSKNPKAYVGFSTDKNVKTRRSNYTAKFKSMFPKANSLTQKAKATGVPVGYLRKSYDRGMAAWRTGHRPGATQQQWGYARVHSLLTCGKTYSTTDSDIVKDAKRKSRSAKRWWDKTC